MKQLYNLYIKYINYITTLLFKIFDQHFLAKNKNIDQIF